MLKFQKDLNSSFQVFAPTRKRDAGHETPDRILARLKSPFPYGRGIKSFHMKQKELTKKLKSEPSGSKVCLKIIHHGKG